MGIAEAAAAAGRRQQALALLGEIAQKDVGAAIAHLRAKRHLDDQGVTAGATAAVGAAAAPLLGLEQAPVFEVEQGLEVGVGLKPDITAPAAVAAGGAPGWHVFFPPKRHDAVATAAGVHGDAGLVNELQKRRSRDGHSEPQP